MRTRDQIFVRKRTKRRISGKSSACDCIPTHDGSQGSDFLKICPKIDSSLFAGSISDRNRPSAQPILIDIYFRIHFREVRNHSSSFRGRVALYRGLFQRIGSGRLARGLIIPAQGRLDLTGTKNCRSRGAFGHGYTRTPNYDGNSESGAAIIVLPSLRSAVNMRRDHVWRLLRIRHRRLRRRGLQSQAEGSGPGVRASEFVRQLKKPGRDQLRDHLVCRLFCFLVRREILAKPIVE
jgi:hypothetical protein